MTTAIVGGELSSGAEAPAVAEEEEEGTAARRETVLGSGRGEGERKWETLAEGLEGLRGGR